MIVEVTNLTRHFGSVRAVDDISFQLQSGQICGFIGPNGAGKTTTMRIMATLDLPSGGDVTIDGVSVIDYPDRIRRRIGFMPDYYGAYANLTVTEYLDFFARTYRLRGWKRKETVRQVMSFTELDKIADKDVTSLSKGMKQRLSLGRMLVHDPELLILDEPAAGLDPRARIELRELLRELAGHGKTIFLSSHILTELGEMCDTVVIIERGKLRASGNIESIKQQFRSQRTAATTPPPLPADHPAANQLPQSPPAKRTQRVIVQLLNRVEQAERMLAEQPDVSDVVARDNSVSCEHHGDGDGLADLLARLVAAGMPVVGFRVEEEDLEDLFMALTDGQVQ